ncbi:MAG: hypothetical protein R2813_07095 [Flavobacteriales bacterium]
MALRKDQRPQSGFNQITISLASPEMILEKSHEILKLKQLTIVLTSLSVMACSASAFSVQRRTTSATAVSTSESDIRESFVIVAVLK